jgi:hypothetical protein
VEYFVQSEKTTEKMDGDPDALEPAAKEDTKMKNSSD